MNTLDIESLLRAKHIGSYSSGHMGSQILRFVRQVDQKPLVVKFAPAVDAAAILDIQANIRGYTQIELIGGSNLLPAELKELLVSDGKALVMSDLGASMRAQNGGLSNCVLLWQHFLSAINPTIAPTNIASSGLPVFVEEVMRQIERFSHGQVPEILERMRRTDWATEWGVSAIMLLDFTPDNLFVSAGRLAFIDPWNQETYLGHPAVSIGQFIALAQLYGLRQVEESANFLVERSALEMPALLGCSVASVELALRLGETLQYVLSSYVRLKSDRVTAAELLAKANKLWQ